jgi:nucleotide-binding universal stress UspA family protein
MITFRKILCPIDFSEPSRRAIDYATTIAGWYGSEVTVLHCHPQINNASAKLPIPAGREEISPIERERLLALVRECADPLRSAGRSALFALREGDPVREILRHAEGLPADLIILGTHGRGGLERLLLGSVAETVLRKAVCPVLTVPRQAGPPAAGTPAIFKRILCPTDFSETSLRAVEYAFSLAKEADARIILLHATEIFPENGAMPEAGSVDMEQHLRRIEQAARQRLRELIPSDASLWSQPETTVVDGRAHREILRAAEERQVDLIVMGVRGSGAVDRLLFGSTTQQIVRHATCPVLTVRSG